MSGQSGDEEYITGGSVTSKAEEGYIIRIIPFEQYLISVKLTQDERFVGILEIAVNKDFRSFRHKISRRMIHYIDEYKPE